MLREPGSEGRIEQRTMHRASGVSGCGCGGGTASGAQALVHTCRRGHSWLTGPCTALRHSQSHASLRKIRLLSSNAVALDVWCIGTPVPFRRPCHLTKNWAGHDPHCSNSQHTKSAMSPTVPALFIYGETFEIVMHQHLGALATMFLQFTQDAKGPTEVCYKCYSNNQHHDTPSVQAIEAQYRSMCLL